MITLAAPSSEEDFRLLADFMQKAYVDGGVDPYDSGLDPVCWLVAADGKPVGFAGYHSFHPIYRRCRLTLWICPDERRKGYGLAAHKKLNELLFMTMNMNRLEGAVHASNRAMMHLLEKAGMRQDGAFHQAAYHNGRFQDYVQFAVLREDWDKEAG